MSEVRTAVAVCLHDDAYFLPAVLRSFAEAGPAFVFVSRVPWNDAPGDWEGAARVAEAAGAEVVLGEWRDERSQRAAAQAFLRERGFTHAFIPDGDEVAEPKLLATLLKLAETAVAARVTVTMDTYWKSAEYVIRPREAIHPVLLVDLRAAEPVGLRHFAGGSELHLGPDHGVLHHLSYAGPDARIARKLQTWSHKQEVYPGWWDEVWLRWDEDQLLRNLHPTHPGAYSFAERIPVPEVLRGVTHHRDTETRRGEVSEAAEAGESLLTDLPDTHTPTRLNTQTAPSPSVSPCLRGEVSVVIPVHGGEADLRQCLASLERCRDLLAEVVVVDDASPDDCALVAASFSWVTLVGTHHRDTEAQRGNTEEARQAEDYPICQSPSAGCPDTHTPTHPHTQTVPSPSVSPCLCGEFSPAGFARACNLGFAHTTGELVLFLNSDTVVPRAGLVRLIEAVTASGSIGAAGPYTNRASQGQQLDPTYTSLETLDLFAEDFAARDREDEETDMLVGFCLLARRSVLLELAHHRDTEAQRCGSVGERVNGCAGEYGCDFTRAPAHPHTKTAPSSSVSGTRKAGGCLCGEFPQVFDEQFGAGTFEDNDLCYRMRRAGFGLVRAARSWVHHHGSRTLLRLQAEGRLDPHALMRRNEALFRKKWEDDLRSGYASHLSGLAPGAIEFRKECHPRKYRRALRERVRRADITLCMIVRDEERVIAACLASALRYFVQVVVVDTGSTDRTVEIARSFGVEVYSFPWTESFAEARNESLRHARGRWIFWMDADDTLPAETGEALLEAALTAPAEVCGFIVPVQFLEAGPGGETVYGTRVDHLKLFRNRPGVRFEGRIHEQILPSLRATGGHVVRLAAPGAERAAAGGSEWGNGRKGEWGAGDSHSPTPPFSHSSRAAAPSLPVVLHSGYDTSPAGQAKKRARDARLLKLDLAERGEHPFVLFNLGMTAHYNGEHRGAVDWMRRSIAAAGEADSHVRKAYALMAVSLRLQGDAEGCLRELKAGLAAVGADLELHFQAGYTLAALGLPAEARQHYEAALACDPSGHFGSFDVGILGYKTLHNLAQACLLAGDYPAARAAWLRALAETPGFVPGAESLAEAALGAGDAETAREALGRLRAFAGPTLQWATLGARLAELEGREPEGWLGSVVAAEPGAVEPRLALVRRLLAKENERDAHPHLLWLDAAGVAEAAYYQGVSWVRRGNLRAALERMERAQALAPGHAATDEQVARLREALGIRLEPEVPAVALDAALEQLAGMYGLEAAALREYAAEDDLGGYGSPGPAAWPGGSVWADEGRALYALARALQPETIVEVGSFPGCSTVHLAAACRRNGKGQVWAVDPALDFGRLDPELAPFVTPVREDVLGWEAPAGIDFLFEDGSHAPGFTGSVLGRLREKLASGAAVLCHDACHARLGAHVWPEFQAGLGAAADRVRIGASDCGLGFGRAA